MKIQDTVEPPFRGQDEDQRKCSLKGGVPSVMVTDTKMKETFIKLGSKAASLEGRVT